ncbi:DUF6929 family protein [Nannocystis bainbridge]|uniref:DUF3616 domain-containing protein n=1 Tax=Nannocystis bainbridge TaxID=2995303 RepID=A0ABT5DV55_9BACT|nr:hypothetical protein [Nannocystis bainbridge]MDC0717465.1 hypothetical protein [Nannocystis bainbridge]
MSSETIHLHHARDLELSAASGLVRRDGWSFVVADDELELHAYPDDGPARRYPLRPGALPTEPEARKRAKPDFEALCPWDGGALLALGSGSRPNRHAGVLVHVAKDMSSATCHEFSLAPLHAALAGLVPELNLEGAALWGDHLVLLQRGNGAGNRSALIRLDRDGVAAAVAARAAWQADLIRDLAFLDLGDREGVPYSVTDAAALPDGGLLLTAAAEDTRDTYADGACLGSALIRLDAPHTVRWRRALPGRLKFEGVWAEPDGDLVRVHLVADADDRSVRAPLCVTVLDPRTGLAR